MSDRLPFLAFGGTVRAQGVGGWLAYPQECQALYDLADVAPGPIVEIGTYLGLSACYLAAPGRQTVYTIDPHDNEFRNPTQHSQVAEVDTEATCLANWEALGIGDRIELVKATSLAAANMQGIPDELGMVFIDGDHKPGPCALDLKLWAPRVMVGGYVALHDYAVRGDEWEAWDVAGCAAEALPSPEWSGPFVAGTVAWFKREA